MRVEQFTPRLNNVLIKVVFKPKGIVLAVKETTRDVISMSVAAISNVPTDLEVGMEVELDEKPMLKLNMRFEDADDNTRYVLVMDRDIIGIIKPITVDISSLN